MFYFRLKVRLPFGRARQKIRLRINREVSRLKQHEKKLQLQLKYMQQNVWKLQKKLQRKSLAQKPKSTDEAPTPSTPVKEAEALMRSDCLTPRKHSKVKRQLKFLIPKTMKLYAVVAHQGTLVSRDVSCFDTCCWQDGVFQPTYPGWVTHVHLVPREEPPQNNQGTTTEPQEEAAQVPPPSPTPPVEPVQAEDQQLDETELEPDWNVGDFVAAKNNGETFAGKITEVEDGEYHITFMEAIPRNPHHFRWPVRDDILWIQPQDIVRKISPPTAKGRSMRSFLLGEGDMIMFGESN